MAPGQKLMFGEKEKNAPVSPEAGCSSPGKRSSWPPHPQVARREGGVGQVHSLTGQHCRGTTAGPGRHGRVQVITTEHQT